SVDQFVVMRSTNPAGPFDPIASVGYWQQSHADATVTPETTYYYRVYLTYLDDTLFTPPPYPSDVSEPVAKATCYLPGPELTAECRSNRILLSWEAPAWVEESTEFDIDQF